MPDDLIWQYRIAVSTALFRCFYSVWLFT